MEVTEEQMRMRLLAYIGKTYGSQTAAAEAWGVTRAHVSNMITGKKRITEAVLKEMGYRKDITKLVTYIKKSPA